MEEARAATYAPPQFLGLGSDGNAGRELGRGAKKSKGGEGREPGRSSHPAAALHRAGREGGGGMEVDFSGASRRALSSGVGLLGLPNPPSPPPLCRGGSQRGKGTFLGSSGLFSHASQSNGSRSAPRRVTNSSQAWRSSVLPHTPRCGGVREDKGAPGDSGLL